jgi:polyisoprenoid-binding protein YceI
MHAVKSLIALSLCAAFAAPAFCAPTVYTVEPNHTYERFSYNHQGFSTQESRFDKTTGTVTLDLAAKTGAVEMTIDTTTVDTGSTLFNGHISGPDFLDTMKFPTATFKSTAVKFNGDMPVSIDGDLTIKGVTKPVTLTITSFKAGQNMMKKEEIGADATTMIKRSDFNMGKFAPMVSDDVKITIAIEANAT